MRSFSLTLFAALMIAAVSVHAETRKISTGLGTTITATTTPAELIFEQPANAELVTDGSMTSAGNWTASLGWIVAGNTATYTNTAASTGTLAQASLAITNGMKYRLVYTLAGMDSGATVTPTIGGSPGTARTTDGTFTEDIFYYSGSTTQTITFTETTTGGATNTLDDVSIREVSDPGYIEWIEMVSTSSAPVVSFAFNANAVTFTNIYGSGRAMTHPAAKTRVLQGQYNEGTAIKRLWYRTATGSSVLTINAR